MTDFIIVLAILEVIGSFIVGGKVNDVVDGGGIIVIITGIIWGILIYSYAVIYGRVENIEQVTEKLLSLQPKNQSSEKSAVLQAKETPIQVRETTAVLTEISDSTKKESSGSPKSLGGIADNIWRCPKCGRINMISNQQCKDCGYNK